MQGAEPLADVLSARPARPFAEMTGSYVGYRYGASTRPPGRGGRGVSFGIDGGS